DGIDNLDDMDDSTEVPTFIPYVTPKTPKKAASSLPAPLSSSTSTSVPINLNLEIVQENNNSNNNMKVNNFSENFSSSKDKLKLLNPNEYLEDDDMEEDLKDFTVVTKAIPFAVVTINNIFAQNDDFRVVSVRYINLTRSVIVYFAMLDAAATALHITIPDLKIENF
ncbi:7156_t:CDS:2, partial [Funneliformis geosporum]